LADIPLGALAGALVLLLLISAFFSGSETALMTLNRYRLRHLADAGHPGARLAARLLEQPDRLIGLILLGNNLVNILASAIATVMALRVGGEGALAIATGLLTLVVLIFAEVTPKTFAALYPERLAFPAAIIYTPLMWVTYPLVWLVNLFARTILKLLGLFPEDTGGDALSREELRTVVNEAGAMIPQRHKKMLLGILDLEQATVEDIMIPRNDIDGVDIEQPLDDVLDDLEKTPYTRVLVYRGSLDNVVGFLHARRVMQLMLHEQLSRERLETLIREPYFIPEGTPLNRQLINFQRENRRVGIVVDEYGDVHGLLTIGDLLEEIVGQFTTDPSDEIASVQPQDDGSFLVDGGAGVRELVRNMHWELPTDGPRTLNGLIVEQLESIPEPGISLLVAGYPVEIIQTQGNAVKTARIRPADRREATPEA
jgi:Mg2+/Co2+ transporter CorB